MVLWKLRVQFHDIWFKMMRTRGGVEFDVLILLHFFCMDAHDLLFIFSMQFGLLLCDEITCEGSFVFTTLLYGYVLPYVKKFTFERDLYCCCRGC